MYFVKDIWKTFIWDIGALNHVFTLGANAISRENFLYWQQLLTFFLSMFKSHQTTYAMAWFNVARFGMVSNNTIIYVPWIKIYSWMSLHPMKSYTPIVWIECIYNGWVWLLIKWLKFACWHVYLFEFPKVALNFSTNAWKLFESDTKFFNNCKWKLFESDTKFLNKCKWKLLQNEICVSTKA